MIACEGLAREAHAQTPGVTEYDDLLVVPLRIYILDRHSLLLISGVIDTRVLQKQRKCLESGVWSVGNSN